MGQSYGWTATVAGDAIWGWSMPIAFGVGLVLSVLGAVAVMWADLDHHSSTATHRYGWASQLLSEDVQDLSAWVFARTATAADRRDPNCRRFRVHRGFTHSLFVGWAVGLVLGGLVAAITWLLSGPWLVLSALVAVGLGGGMATHGYGDCWTNHGCAYLWPLKIRGRRFYPVRVPRWLRLSTGQGAEPWLVPALSGVSTAAAMFTLVPGSWAGAYTVVAGLLDALSA